MEDYSVGVGKFAFSRLLMSLFFYGIHYGPAIMSGRITGMLR